MVIVNVCQVLFIRGSGILICGDSVEESFHLAFNVMSAIEIQVCCCLMSESHKYRIEDLV